MSNFQRIKRIVASADTPEELSCTLITLSAEQQRACLYNTKMGRCDMNVCRRYSNTCCMLGMTEYLKADDEEVTEPVDNSQKSNRWDFIKRLHNGKTFEVTLKNNITVKFEKVHNKAGVSFFVLKDLWMRRYHMNLTNTNKGGFPNSDVNEWLNEDIIHLLPDDLVDKIVPREITLYTDGEAYSTMCKLWIPSVVEVFGKEGWSEQTLAAEPKNEQFDWFREEHHRIKKTLDGSDCCWWLRSLNKNTDTSFWTVNTHGSGSCNSASGVLGIAFGFCVVNSPSR